MNASYTLLYIKAAMLKKRKQCPCKPSSVFLYLKHSTLHSSPKAIGRAALNLRYT